MTFKPPHEAAEIAIRMVREATGPLSYDTETSGVDWKKNFPIGYVTCYKGESVYVPIRHGGGGNLSAGGAGAPPEAAIGPTVPCDFERSLAAAFDDRRRLGLVTVGHNIKFDCHASANAGILLGRKLADTQVFEALIDERVKGFGLEACAERRGLTPKKGAVMYEHLAQLFGGEASRKQMEHFWRTSGTDPVVQDYATGDGITTEELFWAQDQELEAQKLTRVRDLECGLIWTLFRMERRGVKVDVDYLHEARKMMEDDIEEAKRALPEGLNVRSGVQVKQYIEAGAGRFDYPVTDKGNPSFTEKWLKTFDEGRAIVRVRTMTNLVNSFMNPLITEHIHEGRVHANLNQLRADEFGTAARLSCNAPNLQQVPKRRKDLAKIFRRAFVPDEGMFFFEDDYSQCEPRLFGHYSKEPSLLEGYTSNPPRDMHQVVADMMGVERDPTAKRMNMGILTGMSPETFGEHMDWPVDLAKARHREWFEVFPGIKDFQFKAKRVMKQRGFIRTLLGRRGRLEAPRFAYKAVSKIIQGSNADILKWKMLEIDQMLEADGDRGHLLMTIHDAFEGQLPDDDHGRKLHNEMVYIMEDVQGEPFNLLLPFKVDVGSGANWAEASFGAD